MVGHTLTKLYVTVLDKMLSNHLKHGGHKAQGQASFKKNFQTINHNFTLRDIIEEARQRSFKVFYCFVDFMKAFDNVLQHFVLQKLHTTGILWLVIIELYEKVVDWFSTNNELLDFSLVPLVLNKDFLFHLLSLVLT